MIVTRYAKFAFFGIYLVCFVIGAWAPYSRSVWWAENVPMLAIASLIAILGRWHTFSPLAYGMMLVLLVLHTIGGHYTFERVPFEYVTHFLGAQRNHYDRMAHFSVGFYGYAIAEVLYQKRCVRSRFVLLTYPILAIFAVAAIYELFEWIYAISADPKAGIAVLGSQGDIWDAQKDMLADGLGSIVATALFAVRFRGFEGTHGVSRTSTPLG